MISINTVGFESEEQFDQAQSLAKTLNSVVDKDSSECLFVTSTHLTLKVKGFSLLSADFCASTWQKRKSEGKKQGLVRACKPKPGLKIIDATAGWGRDAAVLASFGAEVLMVERHAVMALLLADALVHRSESDKELMKMSLHSGNGISFLQNLKLDEYPDVIYIDPMHPERSKSALVKKEMQALQNMIGPDEDALELIQCAISRVKQRVVVKWPQKIKALLAPDIVVEGKTVRFDVYFPKQNA